VVGLLDKLNPQERRYIIRRYGLDGAAPATLKDIGKDDQITRERVRQIIQLGLNKLRLHMNQQPGSTTELADEPAKEAPKPRRCTPRKNDPVAPQVLRVARKAWSSPALQSA
jgi:hypothetical protein